MAVKIRDAFKRHPKSAQILKGLNMTVPKGTVYSLLGPSGCGKTTLLTCIVGQTELDSGSIALCVDKCKNIGYMPQSPCLHLRMSVLENFYFYGYLFGLMGERIEDRIADLMAFLELQSKHQIIADLSGGQKRRVSMAIALLHEPDLLIMDEPTVGLDPVLSYSIWRRLKELAKLGKTVITTTHYIQEAHHADMIGLMRHGELLAEEPANDLMQRCRCNDLDDAFSQLSGQQDAILNNIRCGSTDSGSAQYPQSRSTVKVFFKDRSKAFSAQKFKGLFYKNMVLLRRDYTILLISIILPFLITFTFNVTVGRNPHGLPVAVVNEELSLANCSSAAYNDCFLNGTGTVPVSCLCIDLLRNKSYVLVEYKNNSAALNDLGKNKVWAAIHFTRNFSTALASRVSDGFHVDPKFLVESSMDLWIDSTSTIFGRLILYDIRRAMVAFLRLAMLNCQMNPKLGSAPITFETPIFGSFDENWISYTSSAVVCINCFILPSILTGVQIFLEKEDGILERTMVTGAGVLDMIAAVFAFQFLVHVIQTVISMSVMYLVFENPLHGSVCTFFSLMMITGVAGIFCGVALGMFVDDFISLASVLSAVLMIVCNITGLVWPVEGMHSVLRSSVWILPITMIVTATRAISLKGFSVFTPVVLKGFAAAGLMNIGFVAVIFIIARYKTTAFKTVR